MSEFSIKVSGLKEAQKALYAFSQQLGDRVVIKALTNGARVMQRQAQANAPVRTGTLKRGIIVRKSRIYNGKRVANKIGVFLTLRQGKRYGARDAYYGKFQEAGWTDRAGRKQPGRQFVARAFATTAERAARLIIQSAITGAQVVARRTGFK